MEELSTFENMIKEAILNLIPGRKLSNGSFLKLDGDVDFETEMKAGNFKE